MGISAFAVRISFSSAVWYEIRDPGFCAIRVSDIPEAPGIFRLHRTYTEIFAILPILLVMFCMLIRGLF